MPRHREQQPWRAGNAAAWAASWGAGVAAGVLLGALLTYAGSTGAPGAEALDAGDLVILPAGTGMAVTLVLYAASFVVSAARRCGSGGEGAA